MNYIDLFHGIGGFALGIYWTKMKFKNHFCSDIDKFCIELYKKRFPESIQLGNIKEIKAKELKKYGKEWIITAGFPCQDISLAGKGKGITGNRSILWFEAWRIIRNLRPKFAIIENVPIITIRGLDRILSNFAEIGYNVEWQTISAVQMGAQHKRERMWIIAYPDNTRLPEFITQGKKQQSRFRFDRMAMCKISQKVDTSQAFLCRGDNGISRRVDRIRGLGNSIVPQIAQLLFLRIKEILEETNEKHC